MFRKSTMLYEMNYSNDNQRHVTTPRTYLEYDGSPRFLLQNAWYAEGLQVRVGVVEEACVVVGEQSLDVVEDETKLIHVFDGLLVRAVVCL